MKIEMMEKKKYTFEPSDQNHHKQTKQKWHTCQPGYLENRCQIQIADVNED